MHVSHQLSLEAAHACLLPEVTSCCCSFLFLLPQAYTLTVEVLGFCIQLERCLPA